MTEQKRPRYRGLVIAILGLVLSWLDDRQAKR